jgi:hypothetical protein
VAHTAIEQAVLRSYGVDTSDRRTLHGHPLLNRCGADEAIAEGYKVFAFVRHPLDRLVSVWASRIREPRKTFNRKLGLPARESFSSFVSRLDCGKTKESIHLAAQSDFVPGPAVVLRYENLDAGWEVIQESWPGMPDLRRVNRSTRRAAAAHATQPAEVACRHLYAEDYRRFAYV